ncbi:MAG: GntR family transcriptional regulator [Candidatus Sumerlaeia bacterium]|nr:GntR family transcriptional regulator [Candidatus Sumerlaeia bacterium]
MNTPEGKELRSSPRLYEIIYGALRDNIVEQGLPPGSLLQEKTLATLFNVSRAPVNKALSLLSEQGFVTHLASRGYVVGANVPDDWEPAPARSLEIYISPEVSRALKARSTWQRIYADAERVIAFAIPFGSYIVNETRMSGHYGVSRTVIREVMGRLEQCGLVQKHRQAHWRAGPLSAKQMEDHYQIRRMLEPPMLEEAGPIIERRLLLEMAGRIEEALAHDDDLTVEQIDTIEADLHVRCLAGLENPVLHRMLQQSQLPLIATSYLFQRYLKIPKGETFIREHDLVVKLLLQGAHRAAASALDAHLESASRVGVLRLEKLNAMKEPDTPPFLTRVVDGS